MFNTKLIIEVSVQVKDLVNKKCYEIRKTKKDYITGLILDDLRRKPKKSKKR